MSDPWSTYMNYVAACERCGRYLREGESYTSPSGVTLCYGCAQEELQETEESDDELAWCIQCAACGLDMSTDDPGWKIYNDHFCYNCGLLVLEDMRREIEGREADNLNVQDC